MAGSVLWLSSLWLSYQLGRIPLLTLFIPYWHTHSPPHFAHAFFLASFFDCLLCHGHWNGFPSQVFFFATNLTKKKTKGSDTSAVSGNLSSIFLLSFWWCLACKEKPGYPVVEANHHRAGLSESHATEGLGSLWITHSHNFRCGGSHNVPTNLKRTKRGIMVLYAEAGNAACILAASILQENWPPPGPRLDWEAHLTMNCKFQQRGLIIWVEDLYSD